MIREEMTPLEVLEHIERRACAAKIIAAAAERVSVDATAVWTRAVEERDSAYAAARLWRRVLGKGVPEEIPF